MFTQRTNEKEWIDLGPDYYSQTEYQDCLNKLFRVNKLLGIFRRCRQLLKQFPPESQILDIGCGGGLFLLNLSNYFPKMKMHGLDINPVAIAQAQKTLAAYQQNNKAHHVSFELQTHPVLVGADNSVDVLLATLVCHHLTNEELIHFFQQALRQTRKAVVIYDLHRHPIAYWFYKYISPFLFRNRLITHDGLLSIRRSFTKKEFIKLLSAAKIKYYCIRWCFPFYWQITLVK